MSQSHNETTLPANGDDSRPPVAPPVAEPYTSLQIALPAALVLLLTFVLASVPARNSDVWRHLATGRAFLANTYIPGTDPFAFTTEGIRWVNHAWFHDVLLYLLYYCTGGHGIVFAKCGLAVALAAFILLAAGLRKNPWTASLAVALALVAIGPHLILGPAVVSYLLFAFTLWWLQRASVASPTDWRLRSHMPLFAAIILWVNCDEWFLLGPIAVGLFWIGSNFHERGAEGSPDAGPRTPLRVFVVALAVCLLNPHFLWAFRMLAALAISPLAIETPASLLRSLLALSWPEIPVPLAACMLLALLALLSCLANRSVYAVPPTVLCLGLFVLSLYRSAAIPFFAIAAGPLLARNWHAATLGQEPPALARLRPLVATSSLLALVVIACPGWLQGPFEPRGWFLHADPSLQKLAENLHVPRLGSDKGAPAARDFNFSVDLAHYIEWFAPQRKVFIDGRTGLFPADVVAEFHTVRGGLSETREKPAWSEIDAVLQRWQVTHLVVGDPSERRLAATLRNLWQAPTAWTLVALEGRATAFVRPRTVAEADQVNRPSLDWQRLAFDPTAASVAPRHGLDCDPQRRPFWDCFAWSDADGAADRDEALVDLIHFDAMQPLYLLRSRQTWEAEAIAAQLATTAAPQSSALLSLAGCCPFTLLVVSREPLTSQTSPLAALVVQMATVQARREDHGPPGSLLLAIRAARRALHVDPNDALTHLRIAQAYGRLQQRTAEQGSFPLLADMRRVQVIVALRRAIELNPDLLAAHESVAELYNDMHAFDLALPHVQAQLRLSQAAGPRWHEALPSFTARIEKLADREQKLGMHVRDLLSLFITQSAELGVYGKARLAEKNGLPAHALKLLQASGYAEFGIEGAMLELDLLLRAGRAGEVRAWINPDWEPAMGAFSFHAIHVLRAAADGDYAQADEHLERLVVSTVAVPELGLPKVRPGPALALLFGQQVLSGGSINPLQPVMQAITLAPGNSPEGQTVFLRRLQGIAIVPRQEADVQTLRGLLALETGDIVPAQRAFRAALDAWHGDDGSAALARHYLGLIREIR